MGQKGFLFVSRQQARCRAGHSACLLLLLRLLLLKLQQLLRVLDLLDLLVELLLLLVVHGFSNLNRGRTHAHHAGLGRRATSLPPFRASRKPRRS